MLKCHAVTLDENGAKFMAIEIGYGRCVSHVGSSVYGSKLHPYMIVNCKTMTKEQLPRVIIVRYQPRGWITNQLTKNCYLVVWNRRPGALLRMPVLDAFKRHFTHQKKLQLLVVP
jgi:hypothetical protein